MKYIKISFGIFVALAASRFVPHPPNFTSLIALSFYVPVLMGRKFIPAVIISFVISDLIIGLHSTVIFTWGSVLIIGYLTKYFKNSIFMRMAGALTGSILFYLITNFGVWSLGMYPSNINGLAQSYIMALPFFGYSIISTLLFSSVIETVCHFYKMIQKKIY
tara:strand:- start:217 stop:702 length:486 start_codon:yes stop_codon:yes gene_type:complete